MTAKKRDEEPERVDPEDEFGTPDTLPPPEAFGPIDAPPIDESTPIKEVRVPRGGAGVEAPHPPPPPAGSGDYQDKLALLDRLRREQDLLSGAIQDLESETQEMDGVGYFDRLASMVDDLAETIRPLTYGGEPTCSEVVLWQKIRGIKDWVDQGLSVAAASAETLSETPSPSS